MIPDRDIWRAANLVIREHRADAEVVAARRADEMLERGDRDGRATGLASHQAGDRRVAIRARGKAELAWWCGRTGHQCEPEATREVTGQ